MSEINVNSFISKDQWESLERKVESGDLSACSCERAYLVVGNDFFEVQLQTAKIPTHFNELEKRCGIELPKTARITLDVQCAYPWKSPNPSTTQTR